MGKKPNLKNEIRRNVVDWNNKFPIDYWWRKKNSISYGSPEHKRMNFLDMLFEYEEEKLMQELDEKNRPEEEVKFEQEQAEIDDQFDNLDINKYNT